MKLSMASESSAVTLTSGSSSPASARAMAASAKRAATSLSGAGSSRAAAVRYAEMLSCFREPHHLDNFGEQPWIFRPMTVRQPWSGSRA